MHGLFVLGFTEPLCLPRSARGFARPCASPAGTRVVQILSVLVSFTAHCHRLTPLQTHTELTRGVSLQGHSLVHNGKGKFSKVLIFYESFRLCHWPFL